MPYDDGLAERLRQILHDRPQVTEKRMFGGLALLDRGNMFVGILRDVLMVRVGPGAYPATLRRPHVREMDFTGKPLRGFVFVDPAGFERDADLQGWVGAALRFVETLPPKAA